MLGLGSIIPYVMGGVAIPAITSLSPSSVPAGSGNTALTVNGSGFTEDAVVRANGTALATTFVSSTQVTTTVPSSYFAAPGSVAITVEDLGGTSSASNVTVTEHTITSLSPSSVPETSSATLLTVNGTNFTASSVIRADGTDLATTFLSSTQIRATVPSSMLETAGTVSVVVRDGTYDTAPASLTVTAIEIANTLVFYRPDLFTTVDGSNQISEIKNAIDPNNGRDATQPNSLNRPGFIASDANFLNRPTIDLSVATNLVTPVFSPVVNQPFAVFLAIRGSGNTNRHIVETSRVGEGVQTRVVTAGNNTQDFVAMQGSGNFEPSPGIDTFNNTRLVCLVFGNNVADASEAYAENALNPVARGNPGTGTFDRLAIGAMGSPPTNSYVGRIAEVRVVTGTPSLQDRIDWFRYAGIRYGKTVVLDASISNISPTNIGQYEAETTLTVNGSFTPSCVVRMNGTNLSTTVVSSGQLTATIPADMLVSAGSHTIDVVDGAHTTNSVTLTIDAWRPRDLGSSCRGEFMSNEGMQVTSGSVTQWNNQAQSLHATQGTFAQQPTYGTGGANNRAFALYDFVDDRLVAAAISNFISGSAYDWMMVIEPTSTTGGNAGALADAATLGSGYIDVWHGNSGDYVHRIYDTAYRTAAIAGGVTANQVTILEGRRDASNIYARVNGATEVSVAAASIPVLTGQLRLGTYARARIYAFVVFNASLSTANRDRVRRYLRHYVGLSVT
jgi:hypothetical protein